MNLAYVSKIGAEGLVYDYLFATQSLTLFQIWIFLAIPSLVLPHLELSRIELPKLTSSILIEIVTIPVVLVDQFYLHTPAHKPLAF